MTPDRESPSAPELDVEQEIDFGRYWDAIVGRWWLPAAGVVVGALIGFLVSSGGSSTYKATAQVYLGTPLAPGGSAPVSSAPTSLGLVANLVTAESSIKQAAARAGLKPGRLRGHVATKPILGVTGGKIGTPAPLIAITVTGSPPRKVAAAANGLAAIVVRRVSGYSNTKIQTLKDQLAYDDRQLEALQNRLDAARANQEQVLTDRSISATNKLVALANLNSVITLALQQQNGLSQDRFQVQQELSLAQNVEASNIVAPAAAVKTSGPSKRIGAVIGALIGLLIGLLAAVLWEPVGTRMRPAPTA